MAKQYETRACSSGTIKDHSDGSLILGFGDGCQRETVADR